jgi:NAD(P)-dependent dehydrogenase (short-subunit alcohol dehydrogenase family)
LLVTGGARGITAEVAIELARRYRPTLLIVGRTPLPPPEEAEDTAGLLLPKDVKAALGARLRLSGEPVSIRHVEAAWNQLMIEREMRDKLGQMRQAGATVHYHQADVRDEEVLKLLVADAYGKYGRIDAVIHGAGIIEDKLLKDKTPESFDRVFDTKADSAFILSSLQRASSLKFLVLFASVTGRFGNIGQCDYGAANEVQNKLAAWLDQQWPTQVVAINWGPWMNAGMASAEVQRRFASRGVQLIPTDAGTRALMHELEHGRKQMPEIVLGDGPWSTTATADDIPGKMPRQGSRQQKYPLLEGLSLEQNSDSRVHTTCVLDPTVHIYLSHHRLDGQPVFPAAFAVELMAELAASGWPEYEIGSIEDVRILSGIVLAGGRPRPIQVVAERTEAGVPPDANRSGLSIAVQIIDAGTSRVCYRATVGLRKGTPVVEQSKHEPLTSLAPFPMSLSEAYARWLFHGPVFQRISAIEGLSEEGLSAMIKAAAPSDCIRGALAGAWLIDPVVVDCGFQLAILHARNFLDVTPLPAYIKRIRCVAPLEGDIRCHFRSEATGTHSLRTQTAFLGGDGQLLACIDDMELSCSRALNRLADRKQAVVGK